MNKRNISLWHYLKIYLRVTIKKISTHPNANITYKSLKNFKFYTFKFKTDFNILVNLEFINLTAHVVMPSIWDKLGEI